MKERSRFSSAAAAVSADTFVVAKPANPPVVNRSTSRRSIEPSQFMSFWREEIKVRSCGDASRKPLEIFLLQENRQIERAAETESMPAHARRIGQGHVGEALEQHRQQDGANGSPRQMRARAMMRAVAKGLVRIWLAQRVVVLTVFEDVLVSVRRRLDRHHGVALWDEATANLRVLHNEVSSPGSARPTA